MIFDEKKYRFMYAALQEAEKALDDLEIPVGAVVVRNNKIIGRGYNQVEKLKDATAHAEMIALTSASNQIGNWRLNECSIYVTLEPCIMCAGAMLQARIKRVVYGCHDPKAGAMGSLYNLESDRRLNHRIEVESPILLGSPLVAVRNLSMARQGLAYLLHPCAGNPPCDHGV